MGLPDRVYAIFTMLVLAGAALWLFDDGSGPLKSIAGRVLPKAESEAFNQEKEGEVMDAKRCGKVVRLNPEWYVDATEPALDASPAAFPDGNRCNPPMPLPVCEGMEAPDPQMMSLLLQYRNRESLWLACKALSQRVTT